LRSCADDAATGAAEQAAPLKTDASVPQSKEERDNLHRCFAKLLSMPIACDISD